MAHIEPDLVTRVGLPLAGKAGINLLIEFTGRIVGNVEQRHGLCRSLTARLVVPLFVSSEEHTSELQSLMRISYAVFCLNKKKNIEVSTSNTICKLYIHAHTNHLTPKQ